MTQVPRGYEMIAAARVRAVVRTDLPASFRSWILGSPLRVPGAAEPIAEGRGGAYRVLLPEVGRAVVRPYRHGGFFGPLLRDRYVGRRPRPFAELAVMVAARDRRVLVPDVLAARVEGQAVYRGTLVTAELAGMLPLLAALRATSQADQRPRLAASAGRAVARMHAAGISHADLNLGNILVTPAAPDADAVLIDFDRGGITSRPLAAAARHASLTRFERSRRKLDPDQEIFDAASVAAFAAAYASTLGAACAS